VCVCVYVCVCVCMCVCVCVWGVCVLHDAFIHVWKHDSFIHIDSVWYTFMHIWMNESCHTHMYLRLFLLHLRAISPKGVMSHIRSSHVTHVHEPFHTYERVTPHIWMNGLSHTCTFAFFCYGVATISRLLKIVGLLQNIVSFIGLFCKRDL